MFISILDLISQTSVPVKVFALLIGLNACCVMSGAQVIGHPSVREFGYKDHQGGGQNYQLVQGSNGLIYIANNLGLLSFDGSGWRNHSIEGGTKVRSVHASDDRIYVGGQNEFGFFSSGFQGELKYTSLKALIPLEEQEFEDVWKINNCEQAICFSTTGKTYIYDGQVIKVIESSEDPGFAVANGGKLYSMDNTGFVKRLKDSKWIDFENAPLTKNVMITAVVKLESGNFLWFTRFEGIFQTGSGRLLRIKNSLKNELKQADVTDAILLSDGSIAVGTATNGLYIIDGENGNLKYHFYEENGLSGGIIHDVFQDVNGSIWLCMNNKVVQLSWTYPFRFINKDQKLFGSGYSAFQEENEIYFGTSLGFFKSVLEDGDTFYRRIEGITGKTHDIQKIGAELIVSSHDGIYKYQDSKLVPISQTIGWWTVIETPQPNIYLAGRYNGLALLEQENGALKFRKQLLNFSESSRVLAFDTNGDLWMSHGYKGVYRVQFYDGYSEISNIDYFDEASGLPSKLLNNVFKVDDELIFTGSSGVFSFDYEIEKFKRHEVLDTLIGSQEHVRYLKEGPDDRIYVITQNFTGVINKNTWSRISIEKEQFNGIHRLLNDDLSNVSIFDEYQVIFGGNDGFIQYRGHPGAEDKMIGLVLRNIRLTNTDSTIHHGYGKPHDNSQYVFDYNNNSIQFEYSIPEYRLADRTYRYKLEGFKGDKWSEWTPAGSKEFTNLREGEYQFLVMGKNAIGSVSEIVQVQFSILPPWYRTNLSRAGGLITITLLGLLGLGLYRKKHKREKRLLIEEQEAKLETKEKELIRLRNEKLEVDINQKKKQLATSTMHLIDKNEFINSVKNKLSGINKGENSGDIFRGLNKIIKEIDKNLDQDADWKQFEINFDQVHGDFLRKIKSEYQNLTPQDIKLCAYLRMNMSTKEVANLLKISVRGVEIARYRLRKKLGIAREVNLSEHIMTFQGGSSIAN